MKIQTNHNLNIEKGRLVETNKTKVICISVYPSLNLILMSTVMMICNKNSIQSKKLKMLMKKKYLILI